MTITCFRCGKEMGDYSSEATQLATCPKCKASEPVYFYRAAKNPRKLLGDILLHHEYTDIIGIENDVGATRIYVASPQAIGQGVVMMHYIRSEEVPLTNALRERIGWPPATTSADGQEGENK